TTARATVRPQRAPLSFADGKLASGHSIQGRTALQYPEFATLTHLARAMAKTRNATQALRSQPQKSAAESHSKKPSDPRRRGRILFLQLKGCVMGRVLYESALIEGADLEGAGVISSA